MTRPRGVTKLQPPLCIAGRSYESLLVIAKKAFERERFSCVVLLAALAEVDLRKHYLAAGYPSMYAWCCGELGLRHHRAYKRIEAARTAAKFPTIFTMVAAGRLCMTAVNQLGPYLDDENAERLLARAADKSKIEIDEIVRGLRQPDLLAACSPCDVAPTIESGIELALERVDFSVTKHEQGLVAGIPNPRPIDLLPAQLSPQRTAPIGERASVPERVTLRLSMSATTHEKLHRVRELLGHAIASGDMDRVIDWMAELSIRHLEKRKGEPQRVPITTNPGSRYIPQAVKRAVWERDGGRCTFTSVSGHRCESRAQLEFHHVVPYARGGETTLDNLRLRCHVHNQYEAEQVYGDAFMARKRESSRGDAEESPTENAPTSVEPAANATPIVANAMLVSPA